MLQLQWLLDHADVAQDVVVAVLSEETSEDLDALKAVIKEGVKITLDLFREPLEAIGYDFMNERSLPSSTMKRVHARLLELQVQEEE